MFHGFKNRGVLIPEKATGVIRGIPVPGAQAPSGARNAGPTRGDAGMAPSLVITWGRGRQNGGAGPKFLI